jgi:transposase
MVHRDVIQALKLEPRIMRYELSEYEWSGIKPMRPNKPRGVPRLDDRRVLNGILWVLRLGAPWRALPENYGHTCYNRFTGHVHQHGACSAGATCS